MFECKNKWFYYPVLYYCALKDGYLVVSGPPSGGHGYNILNSAVQLTPGIRHDLDSDIQKDFILCKTFFFILSWTQKTIYVNVSGVFFFFNGVENNRSVCSW